MGATVIQEQALSPQYSAQFIFNNTCDAPGNYYRSPIGFTGTAFILNLGSPYKINGIYLRNARNDLDNNG